MKNIFLVWLAALTFCGLSLKAQNKNSGTLHVVIGDFIKKKGTAIVVLYDSTVKEMEIESLPKAFQVQRVNVTNQRLSVQFDNVPYGRYAVLVMHDINDNGTFEYVNEDYGLSNNARIAYGPASFKSASFSFREDQQSIHIFLENEINGRTGDHYSNSVALAPVFGYSPETSVLLGANLIKLFKFNGADSSTRTSYVDVLAIGTFNKQIILEQNYTLFSNHEQFIFTGFTGYSKFPQYYYGVGNNTPESNKELINYDLFRFEHLALKKIFHHVFAGLGYRYVSVFNSSSAASGTLATSKVDGYQGAHVSGIQLAISSDARDNIYNPSKGHLLRIKSTFNTGALGSEYIFNAFEIDGRKFFNLSRNQYHILAFQAYGYFTSLQVPWSEMGTLGSDALMRGYYSGRYRDRNYAAAQVEYRHFLNKMFGVVAFAGAGEVASDFDKFDASFIKPNGGVGLRMTIDRKERLNLRLDMGFGQNTSNFYFSVAEAF